MKLTRWERKCFVWGGHVYIWVGLFLFWSLLVVKLIKGNLAEAAMMFLILALTVFVGFLMKDIGVRQKSDPK